MSFVDNLRMKDIVISGMWAKQDLDDGAVSALNPLLIRTRLSRATATELLQTLADVAIRVAGKRMDVQEGSEAEDRERLSAF